MNVNEFIDMVLDSPSKIIDIYITQLEKDSVPKETLIKLIQCWKNNIKYGEHIEYLIDFIEKNSFSNEVVQLMINNNIGIEKLAHSHLSRDVMFKLAKVNNDAKMILARDLYQDNNLNEEKFVRFCKEYYTDEIYEYLLVMENGSVVKDEIADYIALKSSSNESVKKLASTRIKARSLRYEYKEEILREYIEKEEYIYDLEIAKNIFASTDILNCLLQVNGLKYSKNIRNLARETLKKKKLLDE